MRSKDCMMRHAPDVMNASHLSKRFAPAKDQKRACTKICKRLLKPCRRRSRLLHKRRSDFVMPPFTKGHLDMTSLASTIAADIQPIRHSSIPAKLGLALALAALADWLFYGPRIGLSLTLFAIATACVSMLFNHAALDLRRAMIGAAILVAGLVPAVEELNTLSFLILTAALAHGAAARDQSGDDRARGPRPRAAQLCPVRALQVLPRGAPDLQHVGVHPEHRTLAAAGSSRHRLRRLFAAANPLIEQWVSLLNPKIILDYVSIPRVLFWTMMLALVWPFIHVRWRRRKSCHHDRRRRPRATAAPALRIGRVSGTLHHSPLADPVQPAVRGAIHPRRHLSLGPCRAADQFDLCGLCPSRRLSADRDRAARRRLRAGRDAPGRSGGEIEDDPAAGVSLGRDRTSCSSPPPSFASTSTSTSTC